MSARFGKFVFDEPSRELRSGSQRVPLSPKAFELLALLFRERPRALSKDELRDRLWPDTFVGETSLPRVVGEIRRALGDRSDRETFVRTVQRFGYAFVAVVVTNGARPRRSAPGEDLRQAVPCCGASGWSRSPRVRTSWAATRTAR